MKNSVSSPDTKKSLSPDDTKMAQNGDTKYIWWSLEANHIDEQIGLTNLENLGDPCSLL